MKRIDEIIEKLSKLEYFRSGKGASEEVIRQVENKLNIKFSPQYRYFLKKYGWISGSGYEILGIIEDDINKQGVVRYNLNSRLDEKFNKNWIAFEDLAGETVSFDYSRINKAGEPIIFYNLFTYQREDAAKDFISYMEELYEEAIED